MKKPIKAAVTAKKIKAATKKVAVDKVTPLITEQQQKFVDEYIIDLNGAQAAIRAGYSAKSARSTACRLLTNDYIQDAIAEARILQQNRTQITADRVLLEVARLAMYDPRKFFSNTGTPLGIHELDDETAAALTGLDIAVMPENAGHVVKYKLADKGPNLERLMKHLGLYVLDNEQKTDGLTAVLMGIATTNANGFTTVQDDPERKTTAQSNSINPVQDDLDHKDED